MDIVKGRSVRSGGNVLTTLSCSASGISAICCDVTRPTITRLARTFRSTRTRHRREQYMPLVAFCLRHFSADVIIYCECEFRQSQVARQLGSLIKQGDRYLRSLFTAGALAVIRYSKIHGTGNQPWLTTLLARRPNQGRCHRTRQQPVADTSLSGQRVARELDLLIGSRGRP